MQKKLKKDLMPARVKKAKKELTEISHKYIRRRDSKNKDSEFFGGNCFDCGLYDTGAHFQCGHWIPDSVGGAILRYHPHNMHGQRSACNCAWQQEMVKIRYTQEMVRKYGQNRVYELLALKNRVIKADILWYLDLIELYKQGDETAIVDFLEKGV